MSAEKKQDDLSSFEAALAALMPRTDRLDRERLMFFAGRQSATASRVTRKAPALLWPGAFGFMSIVAATLFVMLLLRSGPETVGGVVKHAASDAAIADKVNEDSVADRFNDRSYGNRSMFSLAELSGSNNYKQNNHDSTYSYVQLLSRIIDKGVDSWEPRQRGPYNKKAILTRPLTNRELMKQLLDEGEAGPS